MAENKHNNNTQIGTVIMRGSEEDVEKCLKIAKTALENGNYDKAERFLVKANRMDPSGNFTDFLKQVRTAKEQKATETVKQVNIVKEEELEIDVINIAAKCLIAFEKAFTTGKLEKAERMLKKAKRIDPSLNVEDKLSLVKADKYKKIKDDKTDIDKSNEKCKTAGECLYKSKKAYEAGDLPDAEQFLLQANELDPTLNLEPELSNIRTNMELVAVSNTNRVAEENKNEVPVTTLSPAVPEKTVVGSDKCHLLEYQKSKRAGGSISAGPYSGSFYYEENDQRREIEGTFPESTLAKFFD